MSAMTINQIKQKMNQEQLTSKEIELLRQDNRKGVQKLVQQFDTAQRVKTEWKRRYEEMMAYERKEIARGKQLIAGIDEAGRGPLAGPVVAAAVILPDNYYLEGLNDSKKLSLLKREEFFERITVDTDYGVGVATREEIDQFNIYHATRIAMNRAIEELYQQPDHLLLDAMEIGETTIPQTSLVKGDQRSVSIAAASVIAKVTRDKMMATIHEEYPMYHFQTNQGYGTREHIEALKSHGPSPYHRRSFAPVKESMHA